jgi:hypothetical protein
MKLQKFFPSSSAGNILITTRNRDLCLCSVKDAEAKVSGMDHEEATNLLLRQARADESDENKALAGAIVKVLPFIFVSLESFQTESQHRNSITSLWLSPKLALTFIAGRH